ncbi:tRNA-specific 2-thiouridylase MnmA [Polychytrium aggregatum]|uniref:tRNA-specific 2-thiouridylase MnmA n=1 Tax=Polychytrium aggregatum TaxID=110093 RepID=UPI0022FEBCBF|nr:tRNA-specific 2-thiouridylase MnmA [Polychytrium aggregatum]KAI9208950.1 tRNA-specific 2-thiouridylase MnmA [Polychytrium aggregatum]
MHTVALGMSGGVDSSVSAYLLQQQGYRVHGYYMRNWDEREETGHCPSSQDWEDVQTVCDRLGIECTRVDFTKEYWNSVFTPFLDQLAVGNTPNPDILCNEKIKFGSFFDRYLLSCQGQHKIAADYVATGHYAQMRHDPDGSSHLIRAADRNKDQTYFLSTVSIARLKRTLFPIGHLLKSDVKKLAADLGLPVAQKKESMGICFIGKRKFFDFVEEYIEQTPGEFVSVDGEVLGTHPGLSSHTIGQRASLPSATGTKFYVAGKNFAKNQLIVASSVSHPAMLRDIVKIRTSDFTWIQGQPPPPGPESDGIKTMAKYRYRSDPVACTLSLDGGHVVFKFDFPQVGLAAGQHVAVYDSEGEECLGGGSITETGPWLYSREL